MPRGGYRPGSGRPKGVKNKIRQNAEIKGALTPLEFMLAVMNDPSEDIDRRCRMAISAAPYCHSRAGEKGKKENQVERAKKASKGRFAVGRPPLKLM